MDTASRYGSNCLGVALLEGRASSYVEYRTKPPRARRRTERTWWLPRIVWPCSLVPEGTERVAQTVRWGEFAMVSSAFRADGEGLGPPLFVRHRALCGFARDLIQISRTAASLQKSCTQVRS